MVFIIFPPERLFSASQSASSKNNASRYFSFCNFEIYHNRKRLISFRIFTIVVSLTQCILTVHYRIPLEGLHAFGLLKGQYISCKACIYFFLVKMLVSKTDIQCVFLTWQLKMLVLHAKLTHKTDRLLQERKLTVVYKQKYYT